MIDHGMINSIRKHQVSDRNISIGKGNNKTRFFNKIEESEGYSSKDDDSEDSQPIKKKKNTATKINRSNKLKKKISKVVNLSFEEDDTNNGNKEEQEQEQEQEQPLKKQKRPKLMKKKSEIERLADLEQESAVISTQDQYKKNLSGYKKKKRKRTNLNFDSHLTTKDESNKKKGIFDNFDKESSFEQSRLKEIQKSIEQEQKLKKEKEIAAAAIEDEYDFEDDDIWEI